MTYILCLDFSQAKKNTGCACSAKFEDIRQEYQNHYVTCNVNQIEYRVPNARTTYTMDVTVERNMAAPCSVGPSLMSVGGGCSLAEEGRSYDPCAGHLTIFSCLGSADGGHWRRDWGIEQE
jgi:hypothetical protein